MHNNSTQQHTAQEWLDRQWTFDAVKTAQANYASRISQRLQQSGINRIARLYLQVFKHEKILASWISETGEKYVFYRQFHILAQSGTSGPKRREGDKQIPEGCYEINAWNPKSKYRLSLGLDYPNASDRRLSTAENPGGEIYIHGDQKSTGCIAIGDAIDELYLLTLHQREHNAFPIQVHSFPCRMTDYNMDLLLSDRNKNITLWRSLRSVYMHFQKNKTVPNVWIDHRGYYRIAA